MQSIMKVVMARAVERSTWQGLAVVAGIVGIQVGAAHIEAIVQMVGGAVALIQIFFPEAKAASTDTTASK